MRFTTNQWPSGTNRKALRDQGQSQQIRDCPGDSGTVGAYVSWIQALDTKRPVASLMKGDFYPASVVLFQLHGGLVSHMQVLVIPTSTVNNTKYSYPYHSISFSCLFLSQWCRDVASGANRHLDITYFQIAGSWKLIPCFRTFREAFSHPYFFIY